MISAITKVQDAWGRWRIRRFLRTLDNETLMRHYTVGGAIALVAGDEAMSRFKKAQPLIVAEINRRDWSEIHARICGKVNP